MNAALLLDQVEFLRLEASRKLTPKRRALLGQFMTPPPTAHLMASMFSGTTDNVRLLDAGAGVGSLTAAFVSHICSKRTKPRTLHVTAYEIDKLLAGYLADTLEQCQQTCHLAGIQFKFEIVERDFISDGVQALCQELFDRVSRFDCAILNPPYKKINANSNTRLQLRRIGVEASNLYAGFLAVAMKLLAPGGELVAITPRSFCNGPYFRSFRKMLLCSMSVHRIHVFESRNVLFKEDDVLQENVIFHGTKNRDDSDMNNADKRSALTISASTGTSDTGFTARSVAYDQFVWPDDPECFMHIVPDDLGASIATQFASLHSTLADLGLEVSTGRVVDFRAAAFLRMSPADDAVPLIYPRNFDRGFITWPRPVGKKSLALAVLPSSQHLLVPKGTYVLVKRFSAKEENRRVVAAIYDPARIKAAQVGFENHMNFYHVGGRGLPTALAKGLAGFLNSTLMDLHFRQFSGHTQVNSTDLRNIKYPTKNQLEELGKIITDEFPEQKDLDHSLLEILKMQTRQEQEDAPSSWPRALIV